MLKIPILIGTGRTGASTEKAARYVHAEARAYGFDADLLHAADFMNPVTIRAHEENEHADAWRSVLRAADGLIIVAPEYNHGYPGELKLVLDSAYDEYARKPVGVCGVSRGGFGGVRMVENLWPVLIELGMVPISEAVYFSKVRELFDERGVITDVSYKEKLKACFDEFSWYASALKRAREQT